nr:histidine kinase [uncultured Flavobacterium sp.]
MKIRWREHEIIFVALWAVMEIISLLMRASSFTDMPVFSELHKLFVDSGRSFVFWRNELFPKIAVIVLFLICYVLVNLLLIPSLRKISFSDFDKTAVRTMAKPVLWFSLISAGLAICTNAISYVALPHLSNYSGYRGLALMGYNDHPLADPFFGLSRAVVLIGLLTILAGFREVAIAFIEKPGRNSEFRVLVSNSATPLVFLYLLALLFINADSQYFSSYVVIVTPTLLFWLYLTFWFFPSVSNQAFFRGKMLLKLLTSGFTSSLPCLLLSFGSLNTVIYSLLFFMFLLLIVTPVSWLLYQQRGDRIRQLKRLESQVAQSGADLKFLRSQINPHFLFNALNTLYGTALLEKAESTSEGIQRLGDMMRFVLHENNQEFIAMEKEIEYLNNYIEFQKLRIQTSLNLGIEHNLDCVQCDGIIAPMLLVPFVENAFKHGISLLHKSWINIELQCNEYEIVFEVRNSLHTEFLSDTEKYNSGIGLENVRQRLEFIYPENHSLVITSGAEEFTARLIINIKFQNHA